MFALRPVCLWPGLPAVWLQGVARGLVIALTYTWCVCWLLLATFVWPDWVAAYLLRLLWLVAVSTWLVATVRNCLRLPSLLATVNTHTSLALIEAQGEYLRGNWFEAEAKLLQVLQQQPRDAEALLLLVGVLRRTKRLQPALRKLDQLALLDTSRPWQFEIEREKRLLVSALNEVATEETPE